MKKIGVGVFLVFCFLQVVYPISEFHQDGDRVKLEYVNFSRIESAVKKYEHLQNKAKWMSRLKYAAIGGGVAGIAAMFIFNRSLVDDGGSSGPKVDNPSPDDIRAKSKQIDLEMKQQERKEQADGIIKKASSKALEYAIFTVISSVLSVSFWSIYNRGSDFLSEKFGGIDPRDSEFYKQKHAQVDSLMKHLGSLMLQHDQHFNHELASKYFDLMFADVLIDHTTLVRWVEDIIGFIKCAVILSAGADSIEVECLQKDVVVLSSNLNRFTDDLSEVVNFSENSDRAELIKQTLDKYLVFCKQFSKFIYDCGLYLYEQDFLQN